ncbi:beta-ketoacyl synthase chain length factor [Streptomyces sp. NPDC004393]|uniref:beta-ketoacyl synthase chain length factor n=1 Tax=Streptomyces sp. NPDC004533 TaxID=3154278 RepID=UPI0033AF3B98
MTTTAAKPITLHHVVWPTEGDHDQPPNLPGFTASPFGPIIAHVADRCLSGHWGEPPAPSERAGRTGMVMVSRLGDMATEAAVTGSVDAGTKASPLLFYQSVPSAVLGVVSARWGLGGPVICISPAGDPLAEGLELAELLIEDGSASDVLVVLVELATRDGESDRAEALLVGAPAAHREEGTA